MNPLHMVSSINMREIKEDDTIIKVAYISTTKKVDDLLDACSTLLSTDMKLGTGVW